MQDHAQTPIATYRLQFNRTFTFRDAAALVPYLAALGISHCYASPYLKARPGSMHGYDIIDHNSLNPEIGSPQDYERFVSELHLHGMGQILDIVPNHMGVMGTDNTWWLDVLENGEASQYAEFFDIDWDPIKDELKAKVLVPILADQYGNVLEAGGLKLTLDCERGEFSIFYQQHRFPIDPWEYPRILRFKIERLKEELGAADEDFLELESIATAFDHLPGRVGLSPEQRLERSREKEVQKRRLAVLCGRCPPVRHFLTANVELLNGRPGDPRSFDALHELIKAQSYRLAQWRVAADDVNYRRFFDINDLAALRMENEVVFRKTHRFILELVSRGKVDGLRIDHPDGLYDPKKYLTELRGQSTSGSDPDAIERRPIYVIVEKILTGDEELRPDWPIQGTTGYEFANLVNGLFVDGAAATKMERIYRSFSGQSVEFRDLVYVCKKLILKVALASELNVLANLLSRIALSNRHTCDFTLNSLRSALAEVIASFPVYRTYVTGTGLSADDRRYVEQAVAEGRRRSNATDLSIFDFIRQVLLIEANGYQPDEYQQAIIGFSMKFQQVTAAVMAKGLEDTSFYRYHRLVSLNEVGGNPSKFGSTVAEFHRANQERLDCWPHSMLASSTHDSKRSEDVRARIDVLSEMPAVWRLRLGRWREMNRALKHSIDGALAPSRNDEYLLYQTLVGTFPAETLNDADWRAFSDRIQQYMIKAVREAKEHSSWANTNLEYETAVLQFTQTILERRDNNRFLADFSQFHTQIARVGMFNSLSQCLLKLTAPGVPDIYQGNELLDFRLVDPDNRRPVDYEQRRQMMRDLQREYQTSQQALPDLTALLAHWRNGKAKLYLIWKTLQIRKLESLLFQQGKYVPLYATGPRSEHVCAFAREYADRSAIVVVPRLCAGLLGDTFNTVGEEGVWGDTRLEVPFKATPCYHNVFTSECFPVLGKEGQCLPPLGTLLHNFPVALLLNQRSTC
jgi:(1->4)-alpha-D-glucan 1-alpha-D-glucosylmutase